jgi:calcineurin-like phosphoesterase family protein
MSPGPAWCQIKTGTWFTADLHLGNPSVGLNRPFRTVEQMNETIIARWNERVAPDDTVWLLGSVGDLSPLPRLNGRKYLVATAPDRVPREREHFAGIVTGDGIRRSGRAVRVPLLGGPPFGHPVVLVSPFPYVEAGNAGPLTAPQPPKKGPRPWLLHGAADWAIDPAGHQINVGMDMWDFAPVAADELAALIKDFTPDE